MSQINYSRDLTILYSDGTFVKIDLVDLTNNSSTITLTPSMFPDMSNIVSLVIPTCVTNIQQNTLLNATSLKFLAIPFFGLSKNTQSNFYNIFGSTVASVPRSLVSLKLLDSISSLTQGLLLGADKIKKIEMTNSVTSLGDGCFNQCSALETITLSHNISTIPTACFKGCNNLTNIIIPDGVTTINSEAFMGCSSLRGIVIPNSVTEIKARAFKNCTRLVEISLPNTLTKISEECFYGCALNKYYGGAWEVQWFRVIIPDTVTTIERGAFQNSQLCRVKLPSSLTTIGDYAFSGCTNLVSDGKQYNRLTSEFIEADSGSSLFRDCIVLPKGLVSIGNYAFENSGIRQMEIPQSVTSIGEGVFKKIWQGISTSGTVSLNYMYYIYLKASITTIPKYFLSESKLCGIGGNLFDASENGGYVKLIMENLTKFDDYAFYNCSYLKYSLYLPTSLTSFGNSVFEGCSSLGSNTTITIPQQITSIGTAVFKNCTSLNKVHFSAHNYIDNTTVAEIPESMFEGCTGFTSITGNTSTENSFKIIPKVHIRKNAFKGCSNIRKIDFFSGIVVSIGDSAFENCSNLITLRFDSSSTPDITSIGNRAFYGCVLMVGYPINGSSSIILPSTVTFLGEQAFYNCKSLASIDVSYNVTEIKTETFTGCSALTQVRILANSVVPIASDNGDYAGLSTVNRIRVQSSQLSNYQSTYPTLNFYSI